MKVDLSKITEEMILDMPQKVFLRMFGDIEKAYNICRCVYDSSEYIRNVYSEDLIKEWFDKNHPEYKYRNRSPVRCVAPRQCLFYLLSKHTSLHDDMILVFTKLKMERTAVVHSRKVVLKMISNKNPIYCQILSNFDKNIVKLKINEK